jgi:hypothetical protein
MRQIGHVVGEYHGDVARDLVLDSLRATHDTEVEPSKGGLGRFFSTPKEWPNHSALKESDHQNALPSG